MAGFAKRDDLKFFLGEICGMDYVHHQDLAPTQTMLDGYTKRGATTWAEYESQFLELIGKRRIEETIPYELLDNAVLLRSEHKPEHCHRRLVAEYLAQRRNGVDVKHLVRLISQASRSKNAGMPALVYG